MCPDRKKVIVAMSGGVDSSVAAALLLRAGYDVTGVFMCLGTASGEADQSRGCCSPQDAADARRVAQKLRIDLFVLNLADSFGSIIEYFVSEYARGRTPNPCIHCNAMLKFGRLIAHADAIGAAYVATGHYARMVEHNGAPVIARAKAIAKDQSYALFAIPGDNLRRILLPVGEIEDKAVIRTIARELGLNVHDKPDSQEICFVPDDDYTGLLRKFAPHALQGGPIVNSAGEVLGRHDGFARYTIGQRRGLGVAAGKPMYVTAIDPATATVTIGPKDQVMHRRLKGAGLNWHCDVQREFDAIIQIRYNHQGAPGRVRVCDEGSFEVEFNEPVAAITPGQAAVFYDGLRLLGGGWIDSGQ